MRSPDDFRARNEVEDIDPPIPIQTSGGRRGLIIERFRTGLFFGIQFDDCDHIQYIKGDEGTALMKKC